MKKQDPNQKISSLRFLVYQRPEDPNHLMRRANNTSEIRTPLMVSIRSTRNGVSKQGFRHVQVTDQRTSIDFAHICRDLVDVHFSDAEKIILVCDNLNTHKPASLYKAFQTQDADRIAEKSVLLYA